MNRVLNQAKTLLLNSGILFLLLGTSSLEAAEGLLLSEGLTRSMNALQAEARGVHASEQILQQLLSCSDGLQRSEIQGLASSLQATELQIQTAVEEIPEIQRRLTMELDRLAGLEAHQAQLTARTEAELTAPPAEGAPSRATRQESLSTFQRGLEALRRNRSNLTQEVFTNLQAQNQPLITQARNLRDEVKALQRSVGASSCVTAIRISDRTGVVARYSARRDSGAGDEATPSLAPSRSAQAE
jgi:hypothetical protein